MRFSTWIRTVSLRLLRRPKEEGWPVSAGWGYGPETAVKRDSALIGKNPQCGKTAEEVKKSFVMHRIRAELSISVHHIWKRSVARLEVKHIHTSTEWVDGVPYEKGDYLVSFYFKDEIDVLEADWDAHDGYKKDEAGRKSLDRRDACCRIMSREPFWFATIES